MRRKKAMGATVYTDARISPDAAAGVCKYCNCSEFDPCPEGCAWLDNRQTVCTECEQLEISERAAWLEHRPGRRFGGIIFEAFHGGFVSGWFKLSSTNKYGPRKQPSAFKFWKVGFGAGMKARSIQLKYHGPITNAPPARAKERRLERAMGARA